MKKYTNKILIIAAIAVVAILTVSITCDFQIRFHKNPDQFKKQGVVTKTITLDNNGEVTHSSDTVYTIYPSEN